jgi:general secretion pathway protein E
MPGVTDTSRSVQLPFAFARRCGVLVDGWDAGAVRVCCRRGVRPEALAEAQRYLKAPLHPRAVDTQTFETLLADVYERRADAGLADAVDDTLDLQQAIQAIEEPTDLLEREDDAPVIRLINVLLHEAIRQDASDLHFEPAEGALRIRLRVDGVLRELLSAPAALAPLLVSRVKVMAGLDIAEKRLPQDGRIALRVAQRTLDLRVSTIPAAHGERVVLRVLDKQEQRRDLRELGMDPATRDGFLRLVEQPHGIVLVTGPTGSGKTTTLYAALSHLNDHTRNIMTVEDPIEYYVPHIGQTPVNARTGMTFARGLRAILRQDPDVVMVGEIRDLETAEVAIQASLTGHLVFSTLHTNTAVGAITRLQDLGVARYLIAGSLIGVLAQRLMRRLCSACKAAAPPFTGRAAATIDGEAVLDRYAPVGCAQCNGTGYRGRTGVYELLVVDEALRELIHRGAPEQAMTAHLRTTTPGLRARALELVRSGETTVQEMVRVLGVEGAG